MKTGIAKPVTIAFLLAIVLLCLVILSVLSLSTAAADLRLAEKYAQTVASDYQLEEKAQEWLAELEMQIESGTLETGRIEKTIGDAEERHITIVAEIQNGTYTIREWRRSAPENVDNGMDNLWKGE